MARKRGRIARRKAAARRMACRIASGDPIVCIVTPTLNLTVGEKTVAQAAATAGVPCLTAVVVDEKQQGGCKTANRALKAGVATGVPYIAYINDDVVFRQGWASRLIQVLQSNPKYTVAAPGGKCGTAPQMRARPGMSRGVKVVKQLSFFTAMFKRHVFEKVGYFDESYYHWGCDSDYCVRVRRAGLQLVWVRDVFVVHKTMPHTQRLAHVRAWKRHDVALWKRRKRGPA